MRLFILLVALSVALLASPAVAIPRDCTSLTRAIRDYTADATPQATAAQAASYGLWVPRQLDDQAALVVLVHGLDCDRVNRSGIDRLLLGEGYQVAYFTYPSDQPIADSAAFFGKMMRTLREAYPRVAVNVLAYSMGGLVTRAYVEGSDYAGGVERLILVGTPNGGSGWSRVRVALELQEHYHLWRHEPDWSPTWMITDGLGEAGRDLRPGSRFLKGLNGRPRRQGVKYTIICGDQHPARRVTADWIDRTASWVPRVARGVVRRQASKVRNEASAGDGAVKVDRAMLKGVDDVVIVHADHASLYIGTRHEPPAAWDTIRDRLTR
jgi:pimeloyl-ACP methyl ester carboxylesterase